MIDTSVRPIGIKSDFIPPQSESLFSSKSLAFILLNTMTLGIYGSIETLSKQHKIAALNINQDILQQKAYELNKSWEALENDLRVLNTRINESLPVDRLPVDDEAIQSSLGAITNQVSFLRRPLRHLNKNFENSVTRVALDCIAFFGQLFINAVTLGFYATYQNVALKNEIELIEAKNRYIINKIDQHNENKASAVSGQVTELRHVLERAQDIKDLQQIDLEATRAALLQLNQQIDALNLETQNLNNQLAAAKTTDVQLKKAVQDLTTALNSRTRELRNLNEEQLRLANSGPTQGAEVRKLQASIASYQRDIELARAAADRVALIQREVNQRKFIQANWGEIQKSQRDLGPVEPRYEKRAEDGEIAGAYGINDREDEDDLMSEYAKRYNDKELVVDVVQAGFKFAFDDLLAKAQEPNAYITFNKSSKIHTDAKYLPQKKAIFRRMIWDFIQNAQLKQLDCHGYGLVLNNRDLVLRGSNPVRVQTYRHNGKASELQVRVLLTHVDEFSPAIEDRDLRYGIDPASAKWIFERLSEEEKTYLFNLLMEPLITQDAQQLRALEGFLSQIDNEHVELVRVAYSLICDMALSVEKNFEHKGLLTKLWSEIADAEDLLPLERDQLLIKDPSIKKSRKQAFVPWEPNGDILCHESNNDHMQEVFMGTFYDSFFRTQKVFLHMNADLIKKPLTDDGLPWNNPVRWDNLETDDSHIYGISHQYHGHCMGGRKNLFSTLLSVLMGSGLNSQMVTKFRGIIASSLNTDMIAEQFADRINQAYGLSIVDYQQALKDDRLTRYGDIEIALTALTFGVRIGVFEPGEQTELDENGLMIPVDENRYFGPPTKETLFLYKKSEATYYGLFPKLKAPEMNEASLEIEELRNYWRSHGLVEFS